MGGGEWYCLGSSIQRQLFDLSTVAAVCVHGAVIGSSTMLTTFSVEFTEIIHEKWAEMLQDSFLIGGILHKTFSALHAEMHSCTALAHTHQPS